MKTLKQLVAEGDIETVALIFSGLVGLLIFGECLMVKALYNPPEVVPYLIAWTIAVIVLVLLIAHVAYNAGKNRRVP